MASSAAEQYSHLILNAECDWEDDEHCFTSFEGRGWCILLTYFIYTCFITTYPSRIPKYEVRLDDSASAENVRVIVIAEGPVATGKAVNARHHSIFQYILSNRFPEENIQG